MNNYPKARLVIINTLQQVRDSKGSAGKAGMYGNNCDDISSIKRIADKFNISIILMHHLRKLRDGDEPFNEVSGSTEIIGAADANFTLKRKRSSNEAMLLGSGRDVEYQELNKQVCGSYYNYQYDGYVFVYESGYLTSSFPEFIQRQGMKRMYSHNLRHSCVSLLFANGVSLKQIQEWLDHSDFSTTANIYAHLDYSSKPSSAQAMENRISMPESGDFKSKWKKIEGKIAKSCSLRIFGNNSQNKGGFRGGHKKREIRQPAWLLDFSMAEWVGFEPTVP